MEEGDEEQLATSYSQKNRLRTMGIVNKHAAIKGMPVLKDEEAKMMTQAILAMRGVNQRRMKELHEEGNLKLQEKVLVSKGASTAWMRSLELGDKEDWTQELAMPDGPIARKVSLHALSAGMRKMSNDTKCMHEWASAESLV